METVLPNGQRAKYAITLIWILLALEIISLISSYFQYQLLQSLNAGDYISDEQISANDSREQMIGIIYLIAYLISAVTFIQWFRRAYYNLHIKVDYLAYSEGWAAGAWFVPILNLFRPFQIMKELYVETKALLAKGGSTAGSELSAGFLGGWWALWIISGVIGQFVLRTALKAETIDDFISNTAVSMAGSVLAIPLALITVRVIKNYSAVEHLIAELPAMAESTGEQDNFPEVSEPNPGEQT